MRVYRVGVVRHRFVRASDCRVEVGTPDFRAMPSRVIRTFFYDASRQELRIVFQTGRQYLYKEVPAAIFEGFRQAFSKGVYFNSHIRERFSCQEVSAPPGIAPADRPRR
jgi:hypothetical protein